MISAELLLGTSAIITLIFSLFLLKSSKLISLKKNQSHQVSSLVIDGIKRYGYRSFSSIIQVILYTSLILLILSELFDKPFSWIQVSAFFSGGIAMSLTLYIIAMIIPKKIPIIIEKSKGYFKDGLTVQYNIITALGLLLISILLLSLLITYIWLGTYSMVGFGLGIVFASFFVRIGGGLFKAGSDIGISIFENKETHLPFYDERNPGTLLEISGDYIGKVIGFSADIISSFILSVISLALFSKSLFSNQLINASESISLLNLPFFICAISLFASVIGYFFAKIRISKNHSTNILLETLYVAVIVCGIGIFFIAKNIIHMPLPSIWLGMYQFSPFLAYLSGLLGAILISFTSEVLTSYKYKYSKNLATKAETGAAITSILGLSHGLRSHSFYLFFLLLMTSIAYYFCGIYGIAMACLGMLSITPTIISITSFGPLASSSSKIAKFSNSSTTSLKHTLQLNHLGQSTVAIGNGFASSTAIMSTFSLFFSFLLLSQQNITNLFYIDITWLIGLILGLGIPLITEGYLLKQVAKISISLNIEIIRQFKQIPYLKEGKAKPDLINVSDETSKMSMDGLIIPGILIVLTPILIGYFISLKMVIAFALGTLLSAVSLSFFWANTGDIINNAKHYIEKGHCGGKESHPYKQIEISNNCGHAYKDVLSPALNICIKTVMILAATLLLFS